MAHLFPHQHLSRFHSRIPVTLENQLLDEQLDVAEALVRELAETGTLRMGLGGDVDG